MIPKESDWVMSYDLRSLNEKGKLDDPSAYSFMSDARKGLKKQDPEMEKLFSDFFEDPLSLGVDLSKEILLFHYPSTDTAKTEDAPEIFALSAATWDRSQLRKNLERVLDLDNKGGPSIEKKKGRSYLSLENGLLAWDDTRILYLMAESRARQKGEEKGKSKMDRAERLFEMKGEESLVGTSEDFQSFLEERKDISNWLALGKMSSEYADELDRNLYLNMFGIDPEVKNMKLHSFLEFKEKEVELTHYNKNERWKEWSKGFGKGVDEKLLTHLPDICYIGGSMSYDPGFYYEKLQEENKEMMDSMKKELRKKDLDLKKLVSAFGGDLLFTIHAFDTYEETYSYQKPMQGGFGQSQKGPSFKEVERTEEHLLPRFNVLWNTKGSYLQGVLKERWLNPDSLMHDSLKMIGDGRYRFDGFDFPIYFGWNADKMYLGNSKANFERLFKGPYPASSSLASSEAGSLFGSSANAGYMVMNLEGYPKAVKERLRSNYGSIGKRIVEKATGIFDRLKYRNLEGKNGFRLTLGLKEGEGNSLQRILKSLDENYRSFMMAL